MDGGEDGFRNPSSVVSFMTSTRILCLGAGDGWHANQLRRAAAELSCGFAIASYESLRGRVGDQGTSVECGAGLLADFDVILTRTMPAGSLEQITFRLAALHAVARGFDSRNCSSVSRLPAIVNSPRGLEIAIDKFATLDVVAGLGYPVPDTLVVQSRNEAVDAFRSLGSDCVVKPIFGGEGRGVMRIRDPELAWYTFTTLGNLGAIFHVQRFVPPGGRDRRLLVIGKEVIGIRRESSHDFRTNVSGGGSSHSFDVSDQEQSMALQICDAIGLKFAAVDLIDCEDHGERVLEVNAIPGWKGAQGVVQTSLAHRILRMLIRAAESSPMPELSEVSSNDFGKA